MTVYMNTQPSYPSFGVSPGTLEEKKERLAMLFSNSAFCEEAWLDQPNFFGETQAAFQQRKGCLEQAVQGARACSDEPSYRAQLFQIVSRLAEGNLLSCNNIGEEFYDGVKIHYLVRYAYLFEEPCLLENIESCISQALGFQGAGESVIARSIQNGTGGTVVDILKLCWQQELLPLIRWNNPGGQQVLQAIFERYKFVMSERTRHYISYQGIPAYLDNATLGLVASSVLRHPGYMGLKKRVAEEELVGSLKKLPRLN